MNYAREYIGEWVDANAHFQQEYNESCEVTSQRVEVLRMSLDYPQAGFRHMSLDGMWRVLDPGEPTISDVNDYMLVDFNLHLNGRQVPYGTARCRLDYREQVLYRDNRALPMPAISFTSLISILTSNRNCHTLSITANTVRDDPRIRVLVGELLFSVEYTKETFFPLEVNPLGAELDIFAQRVRECIPALPAKHKGFQVELENNDGRKECFFCGERLIEVDQYMVCKECDLDEN